MPISALVEIQVQGEKITFDIITRFYPFWIELAPVYSPSPGGNSISICRRVNWIFYPWVCWVVSSFVSETFYVTISACLTNGNVRA